MASSITLFGAGSWGTALAIHLAMAGRAVTLWARREEQVQELSRTRQNADHLPDVFLPASVHVTSDLEAATDASDRWGLAVPSQELRSLAEKLRPYARQERTIISLAKGIENESLMTMSQVLGDVFVDVGHEHIGVLSGPSHAEEVAEGRPTTVVAAAADEAVAKDIQETVMTKGLRVYVNTDVIGVEIGGSAKNVLAIAAGIGDGVGYGDNAKAALITRGLAEIRRLGLALGADAKTFGGLAGIGDLVVTCTSRHSRNRYLGEQIGQGHSLDEVLDEMHMVAEGVQTTQSIYQMARQRGLDLPITEAVYGILFEDKEPRQMVEELMTRPAKREHWLPEILQEATSDR